MPVHELEGRISKLEKALSAFSQDLSLALRYIQPDAASSLTKSRIVLEKLLIQVYTTEMAQAPRKALLGDMLADNQFTRRIERRILSRMNAIRDMGNLGPHGEAVEPPDAARVLDDLCEVLEWYLRRYTGFDPGKTAEQEMVPESISPEIERRSTGSPPASSLETQLSNFKSQFEAASHCISPSPHKLANSLAELPPRIVHPLDRVSKFQPRPESKNLRAFWEGGRGAGVLGVIAMGGSGKTALVEQFLCELPGASLDNSAVGKRPELPTPTALFVWSFYRDRKCEAFFEQLAVYLGVGAPVELDLGKLVGMIQVALERRAGGRTLLVLDGLEKLQKERDVAGQFADEAAPLRLLLQWVAGRSRDIRVIATSRFPLRDLGEWKECGYAEISVDELEPAAARALLKTCGVIGSEDELDRLGKEFGWHALTLTHVGGLLARFYRGDPIKAMKLPPVKRFAEFDLQAQRLARVLARYEELLSPEEVAILKAVAAFRLPVTAQAIAGTFAATPLASFHGTGVLVPDELRLMLILSQLSDLRLVQEYRDPKGDPCYSSHPAITQYFYSALLQDTILLHEGATRYLERELQRHDYRLKSGRARPVRTRGAVLQSSPDRGDFPRERIVLDLLEELIYHAARTGRFNEAFAMYHDNLGGYEHLGETLNEYLRGQRIVSQFLDADASRIKEIARAEYERYHTALTKPFAS